MIKMSERVKILFDLQYLYHLPAVEPIVELFIKDDKYDCAITLTKDFDYKFGIIRKSFPKQYFSKYIHNDIRFAKINEIFDVVFVTDTANTKLYQNAQICLVYHGPTFNKSVTYRELQKHSSDKYLIFAESQYAVDKMIDFDCLGISDTKIVGFPKMDSYIHNKFDRQRILTGLGLDKNKKTVLFAPTYKPTSIYDLSDAIFEATKNYNLIIKLHHYSWMGKYANRNQSRIFQKKIKKFEHAVLLPRETFNIIPFYAVADTLISEASGGLIEFLITGKIAIVYELNKQMLQRTNNESLLLHNENFLDDVNIRINDPAQLQVAIDRALNPSQATLKNVSRAKEKYFYKCDGQASQRVKNVIDGIFFNEKTATTM